jgi:hypothetical protein
MTRCELCEAAPHENCDGYTQVMIEDPETRQEGSVWVCLEHFEAIKGALA